MPLGQSGSSRACEYYMFVWLSSSSWTKKRKDEMKSDVVDTFYKSPEWFMCRENACSQSHLRIRSVSPLPLVFSLSLCGMLLLLLLQLSLCPLFDSSIKLTHGVVVEKPVNLHTNATKKKGRRMPFFLGKDRTITTHRHTHARASFLPFFFKLRENQFG